MNRILVGVKTEEYDWYLESILYPVFFPPGYERLIFSISVIGNYIANPEISSYDIEDVIFELRKAYLISLGNDFKYTEIAFSVEKIVSYTYVKLELKKYRRDKKKITRFYQVIEILNLAKKDIVRDSYKSKYYHRNII